MMATACLLYTSDAADDLLCVDLGGRRIIKKKKEKSRIMTTHPMHVPMDDYHYYLTPHTITTQ